MNTCLKSCRAFFMKTAEEKEKALHAMQHVLHFTSQTDNSEVEVALASNVTAEEVSDHTLHNDDSHVCMYV